RYNCNWVCITFCTHMFTKLIVCFFVGTWIYRPQRTFSRDNHLNAVSTQFFQKYTSPKNKKHKKMKKRS
ncbi:hypothetical protein BCR42DRAFT_423169, partial [Absidia repens]